MGSGESTTRKVSFGVDDEDRVRILRGIKLSEDVLQRMKGVANIPPPRTPSPTTPPPRTPSPTTPPPTTPPPRTPSPTSSSRQEDQGTSRSPSPVPAPSPAPCPCPPPPLQPSPPPRTTTDTNTTAANAEDQQKRFEQQQAILQEELAKMLRREREATKDEMSKVLSKERQRTCEEGAKKLAQQLLKKDLELKALEAFYREQLVQFETRNMERFKQSSEQFHQAASKTQATVRPRCTEGVCPDLQAQILTCYKENREQTLRCSDLAKEYMQCIDAAKKNLLVNHG